jgi:hypothetical protein
VFQITLQKSPKPDNKLLAVGSEAKNPLPSKIIDNFSCMDIAGLSWIFLEDPWKIEITHKPDEMECVRI